MSIGFKTNIASQVIQSNIKKTGNDVTKEMEKISSGKRINSASDDPAGLAISTKLSAQIKGLSQAGRNTEDGLSVIQTAEGALGEISNILVRLRELSIQSASDTVGDNERELVDLETQQLKEEIDRISNSTIFNGISLLSSDKDVDEMEFQVGTFKGDENVIKFENAGLDASTGNLDIDGVSVADKSDALDSLESIDHAINMVSEQRASLGAIQSRLHSASNNIDTMKLNQTKALSQVEDTDIADSATKLVSSQITQQAGISTLAQSHNLPSHLLKLVG
ncbi:MAG: flagellin [Bdellovibrionales bacterium RIFOXYB1_FULL_37_110]|nr:MAG: flagellin [Bdellovibrionales bacterium RIFOXYC1_FULL_37_79]OFZ57098.1 MAG: flagellin [Bdellovibrionales bacterium RIFOXYB1_FULL_37_110]OFZ63036.1 MAG: flagellin [Bdellovibrionales bacterium RIFOXYD1_FULL_36_51]